MERIGAIKMKKAFLLIFVLSIALFIVACQTRQTVTEVTETKQTATETKETGTTKPASTGTGTTPTDTTKQTGTSAATKTGTDEAIKSIEEDLNAEELDEIDSILEDIENI